MDTAIVILNYNGRKYLEAFLPSVLKYSVNSKIYVADNQSTDDSVDFLKINYPQIKLIINPSNGGFATGYNEALKLVPEKYYVLLNSDIEVTPNWITPCIELLASSDKIAAVQPKIIAYKRKTHFEHAGAAGGYLDKNYYPFCKGRIFEYVEEDNGQYDQASEIFWATGACMVIKAELYHQMGGLDDDFFAHMEEIDLCWRLKKKGYQLMYTPKSTVYHVGGGTLDYMNPRKTYLNFRNSLYMIVKNHEGHLFFKLIYRLILDGLAALMFLTKFQFKHFLAVFKAHVSLYANWRKLIGKRKKIKSESTAFNKVGLYKKSIVAQKFIKKTKEFSKLDSNDFF